MHTTIHSRDTLNDFSLDADDEMAAGLRLLRLRQVFKVITVLIAVLPGFRCSE